MRADQLEKLRRIQEDVADVFIAEADPKTWPGMETRDARGDRYWHKKNASASLQLVGRIENLLALREGRSSGVPPGAQEADDEAGLASEIKAATKEAERLGREAVARLSKRAKAG